MVASDIVEFDTIAIKVVQDCSAIFITHTVDGLSTSVTEKQRKKLIKFQRCKILFLDLKASNALLKYQ